jgi:ArpU family phage transcriptional regulator
MRRATRFYNRTFDEDKTADRAHQELCMYDQNVALSRRTPGGLQSPQSDGMPKAPTFVNRAEEGIVDHVYAVAWVNQVHSVLHDMTNERYSTILRLYYLKHVQDTDIMERIHLSRSQYYESKKDALIAFAEMWRPLPSELVVKRA